LSPRATYTSGGKLLAPTRLHELPRVTKRNQIVYGLKEGSPLRASAPWSAAASPGARRAVAPAAPPGIHLRAASRHLGSASRSAATAACPPATAKLSGVTP
jgi:hypothetical protein